MFKIKSIYEPPEKEDGFRILIDKSWPGNLPEEDAKADLWLKEIAPTKDIDEWPKKDPAYFDEFKKEYREELMKKKTLLAIIRKMEKDNGTVTLLYSACDPK